MVLICKDFVVFADLIAIKCALIQPDSGCFSDGLSEGRRDGLAIKQIG